MVEGRDRDLVIDAGLGLYNVAEYLDQCGLINPPRKPVLAVATHVHFDHSGGELSDIYVWDLYLLSLSSSHFCLLSFCLRRN